MNLTCITAKCICDNDTLLSLKLRSLEREIIEVRKGVWGMPRLSEAKKDVISCEKLRGLAHTD